MSHVGIYVNETTMYDSNSSGIGYHNWQDSYWQSH
ncbi:NlpC/P60 family protein, partial [Enterococcus faecium]